MDELYKKPTLLIKGTFHKYKIEAGFSLEFTLQ